MKNKHILTIAIASISSVFIAANANAAVNGAYAGGTLGWGTIHQSTFNNSNAPTNTASGDGITESQSTSSNEGGFAGRIFGGYQFTRNFAAELGYTRFHNANSTQSSIITDDEGTSSQTLASTIRTEAVDLVAKGILPLQNCFSLYGKLGAAYLHATNTITLNTVDPVEGNESGRFSGSANKIYPTFGAGVAYDITPHIVADASWNHIQKIGGSSSFSNTDLFGLGLAYNFG